MPPARKVIAPPPPAAFVQRLGARTWGPMAWQAYVEADFLTYQGEFGTYAWTRKQAERKARRLLRRYYRSRSGPAERIA